LPRTEIGKSKYGGLGLFAAEDIAGGARVVEYIGERIAHKEASRRERFYDSIGYHPLFDLTDKVVIDGLIGGNESRFINHSKKRYNVEPAIERGRIWFYANRDIDNGEELLFDYGFDPRRDAKRQLFESVGVG
jgi:SET domain-containing protein